MCLRYTPTIVACVCIHLACKWSNYRIPLSAQGKEWFSYIDAEATHSLLDKLTEEFLAIFDKCPSKLKNKIRDITQASRYIPYFLVKIMLECLYSGSVSEWFQWFQTESPDFSKLFKEPLITKC